MTTKYRRVNLYAGPSCGKSTNRADLFASLKKMKKRGEISIKLEEAPEYVKQWTYDDRTVQGFYQHYLFAKQQHEEERPLRKGVDLVISDSPLLLNACYAEKAGMNTTDCLIKMALEHEKVYPGIHIFLKRGEAAYESVGRWGTESDARDMDERIKKFLIKHLPTYFVEIDSEDYEGILRCVLDTMDIAPKSAKNVALPPSPPVKVSKLTPHWYETFTYECPACGMGQTYKERRHTPKPTDYSKIHHYIPQWCGYC
jgi:hypothetical protein